VNQPSVGSGAGLATVPVEVPGAEHEVVIGPGALDHLGTLVPWPRGARCAALVADATVSALYGARVSSLLEAAGLQVHPVQVPPGEESKSLRTLEAVYRELAAVPLNRNDVVVALGGGVVGDLAGFAAATWNRGVGVVQVPTTLLAQVDSAVGGKTGVNLPEGKNLVGAFHQPLAVVADTTLLQTLPPRELRAGLGEVAKYGFIADPMVLELLEQRPAEAVSGDPRLLAEVVRRGVAVKARVVAADEREGGQRALLNYGHTIGHAIEVLTGYGAYRHGEAVALGMVAAARLGERLGVSAAGLARRTVAVLDGLGLPTGGVRLDPQLVWDVLARDKKALAGVRFVLCTEPGNALVVEPPPRAEVEAVLRSLE
jgi:3-dehydroquinate synthase